MDLREYSGPKKEHVQRPQGGEELGVFQRLDGVGREVGEYRAGARPRRDLHGEFVQYIYWSLRVLTSDNWTSDRVLCTFKDGVS